MNNKVSSSFLVLSMRLNSRFDKNGGKASNYFVDYGEAWDFHFACVQFGVL